MSFDGLECRPRVNASMLPKFQNRTVVLMGMVQQVDQNGTSFRLRTTDGQEVQVNLQEPLSENISGLVEVMGKVDNRNNVTCLQYLNFEQDATDTFDMDAYDQAIQLMHQLSQHYPTGGPPE